MNLLQLPDSLQIWNNAAFDGGGSASKISSTPLREVDLDPSKENRGPEAIRPLLDSTLPKKVAPRVSFRDDAEVDDEISLIEEEIARLGSRLEALREKKAKKPRGRIVPAKFMNPCTPPSKRMEVAPTSSGIRRRGVSLGPLEILATPWIGPRPSPAKNLWPSALKKKADHQSGKANETPIGSSVRDHKIPGLGKLENMEEDHDPKSQPPATATKMTTDAKKTLVTPGNASNRRRAISLGPVEIVASARFRHTDEAVDKQPKRSSSISPASLKPSVGAKNKEGPFHGIIKPKALFQENQSSTSCKRPSKAAKGRVVPSRYSLTTTAGEKQGNKRGKWSLPELSREKTSAAAVTGSELEVQMKTDSQMLDDLDVVVSSLSFTPSSPQSIMKLAAMLPKIKTLRWNTESPRNSGCAKRAAQLVGRRPFLAMSEDEVHDKFAERQP